WDDDELSRVLLLAETLYIYNGRTRRLEVADRLTYWDEGLGMWNMKYFMRHVARVIRDNKIGNYFGIYFNLKGFSVINQQLVREMGTEVMRKYIKGIIDMEEDDEMLCRIGGDNFVGIAKKERLEKTEAYLSGKDVKVNDNYSVSISAVAGFYVVNNEDDIKSPDDLMDRISAAFHMARRGVSNFAYFDEKIVQYQIHTKWVEAQFPNALNNEEFKVFYQPKIGLKDTKLAGAEALCRWFHDGNIIAPMEFIPVLEQSINICKLDFYMLDHVCKDIRRWLDEGKNVVRVSVNLSRRHLTDTNILQRIVDIIDGNNVPHEYIEIELTETTTDVGFRDLKLLVNGLQSLGISTAVDDFGVGYSSLNLIRDIPWNVLKLDKSFLPDENDPKEEEKSIMLKYVIAMAQSLGLECIVEGVETEEHVEMLKENCCYLAQGFYFDRPLPKEQFENKLG
ncbi:MAG: GGDEF domain-containing protein, partial [Lachnospiraceae bacterium]|nr:GGDEF domain-containing protein [Lachnospiraceae bacterium]